MKEKWDGLTYDEKQDLEDFIVHNSTDHIEKLQELGFARQDERDGHWFVTQDGFECYQAGVPKTD